MQELTFWKIKSVLAGRAGRRRRVAPVRTVQVYRDGPALGEKRGPYRDGSASGKNGARSGRVLLGQEEETVSGRARLGREQRTVSGRSQGALAPGWRGVCEYLGAKST